MAVIRQSITKIQIAELKYTKEMRKSSEISRSKKRVPKEKKIE